MRLRVRSVYFHMMLENKYFDKSLYSHWARMFINKYNMRVK